jgi:septal ring factor EnvC (AmiA/AmiB activator)
MDGFVYLALIVFLLSVNSLYADEITQREQELTDVQTQIEDHRERANQAAQRRRSAEQSRQETQRNLNTTQRRIQELNTTEQSLRRSLVTSRDNLNQTDNRLIELQNSTNELMLLLLRLDQAEVKLHDNQNDARYLSVLVRRLIFENRRVGVERLRLLGETNIREREVDNAVALAATERARVSNISTNLRQLDMNIVAFEREQQEYQTRANELEQIAVALQTLINSLNIEDRLAQMSFVFPSGFEAPVIGRILTNFGPKRHDRYDITTFSNGIIVAVPINSSIRAFADGEVVYADWFAGTGRMIIIDHKNGYHTVYSYNNNLLVQRGDIVSRGQIIAESGQTGAATEPSLQFEIRRNGVAVDPMDFLRNYEL